MIHFLFILCLFYKLWGELQLLLSKVLQIFISKGSYGKIMQS